MKTYTNLHDILSSSDIEAIEEEAFSLMEDQAGEESDQEPLFEWISNGNLSAEAENILFTEENDSAWEVIDAWVNEMFTAGDWK